MPFAARPTRLALTAALLLAGVLHGPDAARADAALAVGRPADVARQGLAVGWAVDHAGRDAAEKEALAPKRRPSCRVALVRCDGR
jgi:hypothetical protein